MSTFRGGQPQPFLLVMELQFKQLEHGPRRDTGIWFLYSRINPSGIFHVSDNINRYQGFLIFNELTSRLFTREGAIRKVITAFWSVKTTTKPKSQPVETVSSSPLTLHPPATSLSPITRSCLMNDLFQLQNMQECFYFHDSKVNNFHVSHNLIEMPETVK